VRHWIGFVLLTVAVLVANFTGESTPLIRKRVSEVQFTLVATDRNDRPLPSLSPADITVLEGGHPIPHFELRSAADLPLRVGIVLDLSDSTQKSWADARGPLIRSLAEVMRPKDELLVLAFNSRIEIERTIGGPAQLETALQPTASGGLMALYDATYHTCGHAIFVGPGAAPVSADSVLGRRRRSQPPRPQRGDRQGGTQRDFDLHRFNPQPEVAHARRQRAA
jgi:hypothetical protein